MDDLDFIEWSIISWYNFFGRISEFLDELEI